MQILADLIGAGIGGLGGPTYDPTLYQQNWKQPTKWDFQFDKTAKPYLTASKVQGQASNMLHDPNAAYMSSLIQALRASSNAPAGENSGFTQYQSAQK